MAHRKEVWYCWRELLVPEHEEGPRLLIPWADPYAYEFAFDFIYETVEQAREGKEKMGAADEDWLLCRLTLETL